MLYILLAAYGSTVGMSAFMKIEPENSNTDKPLLVTGSTSK